MKSSLPQENVSRIIPRCNDESWELKSSKTGDSDGVVAKKWMICHSVSISWIIGTSSSLILETSFWDKWICKWMHFRFLNYKIKFIKQFVLCSMHFMFVLYYTKMPSSIKRKVHVISQRQINIQRFPNANHSLSITLTMASCFKNDFKKF